MEDGTEYFVHLAWKWHTSLSTYILLARAGHMLHLRYKRAWKHFPVCPGRGKFDEDLAMLQLAREGWILEHEFGLNVESSRQKR